MDISERVAARHLGEPVPERARAKTAAFPPPQEEAPAATRNIPKDHDFDKRALKPLSKALWACSVAQGHALTAYRQMSRLKSTTVSPDGMLGGRGYTQNLKDMRKSLHEAAETLSSICDTLHDEVTAPHWQPKMAQLDEEDQGDVSRFIDESQEYMDDPEGEVEEDIEEIEKESPKTDKETGLEENSSSMPAAGEYQEQGGQVKTASLSSPLWTQEPVDFTASDIWAGVTPDAPEGGPRVDDRDPSGNNGDLGEFNEPEPAPPPDQWSADGGGPGRRAPYGEDYDYPSPWENTASWKAAESSVPDGDPDNPALEYVKDAASGHPVDDTPTEGRDFGIGFGARGEGTQHTNPSGEGAGYKGVFGPHSELPGTPSLSSGDTPDEIDTALNDKRAYEILYGQGKLPQDAVEPVSRSDYYPGKKDNMVTVGQSDLPGDERVDGVGGQPLVDTFYTETDMDTGYVRWDGTTKTLKEPEGNHPGQDHQEPWAPDGEATR